MASHNGCEGVVKVGTDAIAEVTSWSLNETTEIEKYHVLGDCDAKKKTKGKDATGEMTCKWDETDTAGQGVLINGAEGLTLNLYPEGDVVGDNFATMTIGVSSVTVNASADGMVEKSISFEVDGGITWGDVV